MSVVVDASMVVAALVDVGPHGTWAGEVLGNHALAAPHLLPVEVASVLRRAARRGDLSVDTATLAHADLMTLRIELFAYAPFADRAWDLRENVSLYDAWYVAVAEQLSTPMATLDHRLMRATGPRCGFLTSPG